MRTKIIALMVIMAAQAQAQTLLSYTNVRADVSGGPAFSSSAVAGSFRFTYVVEDTPGVPLNLDDGTTFRLEAWAADGVRAHNVASTNLVSTDLSSGQVRFVVPSIGVGEYRIRGVAQPAGGDTSLVWQITHHMLTVTSAPSAGGASVSVSVTTTASVTVASSGSGNVVTGITANGSVVTEHRGTVEGGGGAVTINGHTGTNFNFLGMSLITVTNAGGDIYIGVGSFGGGIIVAPAYSNISEMTTALGQITNLYQCAPAQTTLTVYGWSAAAIYSPGCFWSGTRNVTGGQFVAGMVGTGGRFATNAVALGGWPGGGDGTSTNVYWVGSSGGYSALMDGTNLTVVLSPGAGAQVTTYRAPGGDHLLGVGWGIVSAGGGATATNHGARASNNTNAIAGAYLKGGNGSPTGGTYPGCGGSPGVYSGGGGGGNAGAGQGVAGSGVSWWDTNIWYNVTCVRQATDSANPPFTSLPVYKSPWGVAPSAATTNQAQSNGGAWVFTAP